MRVTWFALSFLLILASSPRLNSQQSATAPQCDPQAIAVLAQMAAATGWAGPNLPQDVTASGTMVRKSGNTQLTTAIQLKARGPSQHRIDLQDAVQPRATIVNSSAGAYVLGRVGTRSMPPHAALSTPPIMFPFFTQLADFKQSGISVTYLGTEPIAGELAHKIAISRDPAGQDVLADTIRRASPLVVWVSATTYLPIQVDYIVLAPANRRAALHFVRRFSDYRTVQAIRVPYHQEEWVEGELQYVLELSAVQFNVGLSDVDFAVPVP